MATSLVYSPLFASLLTHAIILFSGDQANPPGRKKAGLESLARGLSSPSGKTRLIDVSIRLLFSLKYANFRPSGEIVAMAPVSFPLFISSSPPPFTEILYERPHRLPGSVLR